MDLLIAYGFAVVVNSAVLAISIVIVSRLMGDIEFGPLKTVVLKGFCLVVVATALSIVPFGIWFGVVVWLFGIMALFRLPFQDAWILAVINWGLGWVTHSVLL